MKPEPGKPRPYLGDQLISDESFLRRLPVAVAAKDRVRFDAIVTASDIISQAFNALRGFATGAGVDLEKFTNAARAFALGQCWTMVDQLHAIRQLIRPGENGKPGPLSQALLEAAQPATMMRNSMDHLAAKLDNLSKRKGFRSPLFGTLSYFYTTDAEPRGGSMVTIMAGSLMGEEAMALTNPLGREFAIPVGLFTLAAFGYGIEFGTAIGSLRDWLQATEVSTEQDILEHVNAQAKSPEHREKLLESMGGGMTIIANIEFAVAAKGT